MTDRRLHLIAFRAAEERSAYLSTLSYEELEEIGEELISRFPNKFPDKEVVDPQQEKLFDLRQSVIWELKKRDSKAKEVERSKNYQFSDEELLHFVSRIRENDKLIEAIPDSELKAISTEILRRYPFTGGIEVIVGGSLKDKLYKLSPAILQEIKRRETEGIAIPDVVVDQGKPYSTVRLNPDIKGAKTNLLRIIDALWELKYFTTEKGIASKSEVVNLLSLLLNEEFPNFESALSQAYNHTSLEANLMIFNEMRSKIEKKTTNKE